MTRLKIRAAAEAAFTVLSYLLILIIGVPLLTWTALATAPYSFYIMAAFGAVAMTLWLAIVFAVNYEDNVSRAEASHDPR